MLRQPARSRFLLTAFTIVGLALPACSQDAPDGEQSAAGLRLRAPVISSRWNGAQRALNEKMSHDLKPADNAAVLLVQIFGVEVFDLPLRNDSLEMMGIDALNESGPRFTYVDPYAAALPDKTDEEKAAEVTDVQQGLRESAWNPWKREQNAALARFLEANKPALDLLVTACSKPRYFVPFLSEEEPPRLMSTSFAVERRLTYVANCLCARAMLRVTEGDFAGAKSDLLAVHRLAYLLAAGSPLDMSVAKAHGILAVVYGAETGLLHSGQLSGEQAAEYLAALQELPQIPGPAHAADIGERAVVRQEIELLKTDRESVVGFFEHEGKDVSKQVDEFMNAGIDWDLALRRADEIQDGVVQALSMTDHAQQDEQFSKLDTEYEKWGEQIDPTSKSFAEHFKRDPQGTSRWVGEAVAFSLRPNCWQRRTTDERGKNRLALVTLGLALTVYRHKHGEYPPALADLAPETLKEIPLDPHSGKPFTYHRGETGARVTSWGMNLVDDAGQDYNDDQILELP